MVASDVASLLGINPYLLFVIVVWTLVWKAFSLWKSASKRQPIWFIVLLLVNTLGILEILYIYVFSEMKGNGKNGRKQARVSKRKSGRKRREILK